MNNENNSNINSQYIMPNLPENKDKKKITILLITNILTFIALIIFVLLFIFNSDNTTKTSTSSETEKFEYVATAADEPVSDDWKDYQFSIKGKTLSLPCTYAEFKDISGFSMKSADEKSYIQPHYSIGVNLYIKNSEKEILALYVDVKNETSEDLCYSKSNIVRISQTLSQVQGNKADIITFPKNLTVGMEISKEKIIELLGEPDDVKEYNSENYSDIELTYNADDEWTTINLYKIEIKNGKIESLTLDHKKNE